MKKQHSGFLSGLVAGGLLISLMVGATAAGGGVVSFNTVGLRINGVQVADAGEDMALEDGRQVPGTILYTDSSGGGTTYLPARRIGELLGVEIGWDAPSGSVTVGDSAVAEVPAPALPQPEAQEPETVTVYVTQTGSKYHTAGCRYLRQSQSPLSLGDAQDRGYSPCALCHPPQ